MKQVNIDPMDIIENYLNGSLDRYFRNSWVKDVWGTSEKQARRKLIIKEERVLTRICKGKKQIYNGKRWVNYYL